MRPIFTNEWLPITTIKDHLRNQKEDILNNMQGDDSSRIGDHIPTPEELFTMHKDNNMSFSVQTCDIRDPSHIGREIIDRYQWNNKDELTKFGIKSNKSY